MQIWAFCIGVRRCSAILRKLWKKHKISENIQKTSDNIMQLGEILS